jgi:polyisoprenoid-binding protein YceI
MNISKKILWVGACLLLTLFSFTSQAQIKSVKATFYITNTKGDKKLINGAFTDISSNMAFDPGKLWAAFFDVTLHVKGITTGNAKKDSILKSDRFFDPSVYPDIQFTSTRVYQDSVDAMHVIYKVDGKLTIKDITQTVTLRFESFRNSGATTFKGRLDLDRNLYHLVAPPGIGQYVSILLETTVPQS